MGRVCTVDRVGAMGRLNAVGGLNGVGACGQDLSTAMSHVLVSFRNLVTQWHIWSHRSSER